MAVPVDAKKLQTLQAELEELKNRAPLESFFHRLKPGQELLLHEREPLELKILQIWPLPKAPLNETLAQALRTSLFWEFSPLNPLDTDCMSLMEKIRGAQKLCLLWHQPIIDPWQIYYARYLGAQAISIYPAILSPADLLTLILLCKELGMTAIPALLSRSCLQQSLQTPAPWLAIREANPLGPNLSPQEILEIGAEIPENRKLILFHTKDNPGLMEEFNELTPEAFFTPAELYMKPKPKSGKPPARAF